MSNINYDVWGSPSDWKYKGSSTPTSAPGGTLYGQQRIGASDWTNSDFNDYPAFKFGYTSILKNYYNAGRIGVNVPVDNTIAYAAMDNPDLPQQNVIVLDYIHNSINNPLAKTDRNTPSPFSLCWYYKSGANTAPPSWNGQLYGFDGFPNNAVVFSTQGLQRVAPYAAIEGNDDWNVNWGQYNPNFRLMPCVEFGVQSIILEINVKYLVSSNTVSTATLGSYLTHNAEWLHEHQVIGVWCEPYYRVNIDGTYAGKAPNVSLDSTFTGLQPMFFRPYNLQNINIYNYIAFIIRDSNLSGNFPVYGLAGADGGTSQVYIDSSAQSDPDQTHMSSYACIYGANRGELTNIQGSTSARFMLKLDLSIPENVEYIRRGAAAYGMFFCDAIGSLGNAGRDSGDTERWIDPDMYCGTISDRGYTNGDYTRGEGNKNQKQYIMKASTESPYDPDIPPQPKNIYDHQTVFNHIGDLAALTKRYVMSGDMVEILGQMLYDVGYTISSGDTDFSEYDSKILDTFLTNNPIDAIISLRRYPMTIPHSESLSNVLLGKYDTMLSTYTTSAAALTYLFQLRDPILPRFGDSFLDYEPYTHFELYVPFCGTVVLEPADILNRSLSVQLLVDFTTGTCTAFVMSDLLCIKTVEGNIAIDIPVTGVQSVTAASQLNNAIVSRKQAQVNTVTAGLSFISPGGIGNPFKTVGNLITAGEQLNKAEYDLQHQNVPPHVIGAASPVAGWAIDLQCRLIIYYPDGDIIRKENGIPVWNTSELAKYGKTAGFATVEAVNQLSDYAPGLIIATDVDLSGISCTEEERELIVAALSEGCYFPNLT